MSAECRDYSWFRTASFNEEVCGLASLTESLTAEQRDFVEAHAPAAVADLITRAAENGMRYVEDERGVITDYWVTGGMLSGSGVDLFHPSPGFVRRVKREAAAAIRWLRKNLGVGGERETHDPLPPESGSPDPQPPATEPEEDAELDKTSEEGAKKWLRKKWAEAAEARIYTDIKHGDRKIKRFIRSLGKEWEFIVRGEASESPYHQWECAFYLGRSKDRKRYALQLVDFGDPDTWEDGDDEDEGYSKVVAILENPGTDDESLIARTLLSVYWKHGGKYIEGYIDLGRFDLSEME